MPCSLQPATAGDEFHKAGYDCMVWAAYNFAYGEISLMMRNGSCAIECREPCQAGNRAALIGFLRCAAGAPVLNERCGVRIESCVQLVVYGFIFALAFFIIGGVLIA